MEEAVRRRLGTSDFRLLEFTAGTGEAESQGFLGIHMVVRATVHYQGEEKQLRFFAKGMPTEASVSEMIQGINAFNKEDSFYNKLYVPLTQAWESVSTGPPCKDLFAEPEPHWGPRCYYCSDRLVILQDLTRLGYRALDSDWLHKGLTYKETKAILRALAGLHASSLVLQRGPKSGPETCPTTMAPILEEEDFLCTNPNTVSRRIFKCGMKALSDAVLPQIVKRLPNDGASAELERLRAMFPQIMEQTTLDEIRARAGGEVQVVSHGDCWPNNMLHQFDADGQPVRAVLIDFQLTRWAPPAWDVMMLLHVGCTPEFRKKHLDELLREYYGSLTFFTSRRGVDIDTVLPLQTFLKGAHSLRPIALTVASVYLGIIGAPKESIGPILMDPVKYKNFMVESRSEATGKWLEEHADYRDRYLPLVCELLELPYDLLTTSQ